MQIHRLIPFAAVLLPLVAFAAEPPRSLPGLETSLAPSRGDALRAQTKTATVAGSWDFEDGLGGPDPQGWTSRDRTQQTNHTRITDFAGLPAPYGPISGSQSLWCGEADPRLVDGAGYGDNWDQPFESRAFSITGDVTISFDLVYDTEPNYDFVTLEADIGAGWTVVHSWDGAGAGPESYVVPQMASSTMRFRFRFTSDGAWSDEDGQWPTDGAYVLDNLVVSDSSGILDNETFEDEGVGAQTTTDGDWGFVVPPAFGDFAGLFDGSTVVQEQATTPNATHVWGFFNGSTDTYACGGFAGQLAVPLKKGSPPNELYIENEILSPWMPVPGAGETSMRVSFDLYRPYLASPGVLIHPRVYSLVAGLEVEAATTIVYFASDWQRFGLDLIDLLDPAATQFRIGFTAVEYAVWAAPCHDAAPLIDNVEVCFDDFLVTNANDGGAGSLRDAIARVNAATWGPSYPPTIGFDLGGSPVITPLSALPDVTSSVRIDGRTQPNYAGFPVVQLAGGSAGVGAPGLHLVADRCEVLGLAIRGFSGAGIQISGNSATVQSCYLGLDPLGNPAGNGGAGIRVDATNTGAWIGGDDPAESNWIANNSGDGIDIAGDGVLIYGNRITENGLLGINLGTPGVDTNDPQDIDTGPNGLMNHPVITAADAPTGAIAFQTDLESGSYDIRFYLSPTADPSGYGEGAILLGTATISSSGIGLEAHNVGVGAFAGNGFVSAMATQTNVGSSEFGPVYPLGTIVTNTNDSGPGSLRQAMLDANTFPGVEVSFAIPGPGVQVIAPQSPLPILTQTTVIDARTQPGYSGSPLIELDGTNAIGVLSQGVYFSADNCQLYGLAIHSFQDEAVLLDSHNSVLQACWIGLDGQGNVVGNAKSGVATGCAVGSQIGGVLPGQANTIAGNGQYGVWVQGGSGISIRGNLIYGNADMDINLGSNGAEPNDSLDADPGPNGLQNHPLLVSATPSTGAVSGNLSSGPSSWYSIDVYGTDFCHPVGHGGAKQYLGSTSLQTNGVGFAAFNFNVGAFPDGLVLTATATAFADLSTSEFGPCLVTPNTPTGASVSVSPIDPDTGVSPATIVFSAIVLAGTTSITSNFSLPTLPAGLHTGGPGSQADITTTAGYTTPITVTMSYDDTLFGDESQMRLWHYDGGIWFDRTASVDPSNNTVTALVYSLSPFVVTGEDPATAIAGATPEQTALVGAYPNPFNPRTVIRWRLSDPGEVSLRVLDIAGRVVRTLVDGQRAAGSHEVVWNGMDADGRRVASGMYFYRLQAGGREETRKLVLIK